MVHQFDVGAVVDAAVLPLLEWQPAVADMVLVGACCGIETGVGIFPDGKDVEDGNVGGQQAVEFEGELGAVDRLFGGEVGVEVAGVNAGVGTATTHDGYGLSQQGAQSLLQCQLHRGQVGLGLSAAVVGAVVCQMNEIAHYSNFLVFNS